MKYVFCMFLLGCSGDTFMSIQPAIFIDSGVESSIDGDQTEASVEASTDGQVETSILDSTPDTPKPICTDLNDVEYNQKCFYLDGSKGVCDSGYIVSSNAMLAAILGANPNAWQGKNYRHQISDNACVLTKDNVENYGMVTHANQPGPFGTGEPIWNGSSCTGVYFTQPKQLTLCERIGQ